MVFCCCGGSSGIESWAPHKRKRPRTRLSPGTFVEQPSPEVCSQGFYGSCCGINMARMGYSEATALNDPRTELVILGLSENAAVTTCGWARHFFDSGGSSGF
jgi:hypothetical protein